MNSYENIIVHDPPKTNEKGRPKHKKQKEKADTDIEVEEKLAFKKKRVVHCSWCKKSGHYEVTCKVKKEKELHKSKLGSNINLDRSSVVHKQAEIDQYMNSASETESTHIPSPKQQQNAMPIEKSENEYPDLDIEPLEEYEDIQLFE